MFAATMQWRLGQKHYSSVQIWTFHIILHKGFWFGNQVPPNWAGGWQK